MAKVSVYELVYDDDYANSHKVYRLYVIAPTNAPPLWMAQWGRKDIEIGAGQWSLKSDGHGSTDMALRQRDAKLSKGYDQTGYADFEILDNYCTDRIRLDREGRVAMSSPSAAAEQERLRKAKEQARQEAVTRSLQDMVRKARS